MQLQMLCALLLEVAAYLMHPYGLYRRPCMQMPATESCSTGAEAFAV